MLKKADNQKRVRQPYSTPKVVVYGAVEDITRAVGNKAAKDNGSAYYHGTH